MRLILFLLLLLLLGAVASGQEEKRVTAVGPEVSAPTGGRWALVIGVSEYQDEQIKDLQFPGRDARSIYEVLTDPDRGGFDSNNVLLITEDQENPALRPTLENIISKLQALSRQAKGAEEVFLYFSGHGFSREGVSYLLPSDVRLGLLERDGVRVAEIEEKLKEINPGKAVVILDACRNEPLKEAGGMGLSGEGAMDQAFTGYLQSLAAVEGRAVISSCKLGQRSWEDPHLQSGVFTHFLVQALGQLEADRDKDGAVSMGEVMTYLPEKMKRWSLENAPREQEPRFDLSVSGDLVLIGKRTPPQPGSLNIATEPSGAEVFLDGKRQGKSPLTVLNLSPGEHSAVASMEGRAEASATAIVRAGGEAFLSLVLPQASGTLRVDSQPSAAQVFLDGLLRGTTPLSIPALSLGDHSLRLSLEGYYDYSASMTVEAAERALSIPLLRISGPEAPALGVGFLFVSSEPEGIEVLLDGRPVGKTPLTLTSVSLGEHQVELRSPIHDNFSQKVQVEEKKVARLEHKMVPAAGSLTMSTDIEGAQVLLDAKVVQTGPGRKTLAGVPLGRHEIVLEVPLGRLVREIILEKSRPLTLDLSRAQTLGVITVLTREARSGPLLDGRPIPGSSPVTVEDVPMGTHVVHFSRAVLSSGGLEISEAALLTVRPGETVVASEFTKLLGAAWPDLPVWLLAYVALDAQLTFPREAPLTRYTAAMLLSAAMPLPLAPPCPWIP